MENEKKTYETPVITMVEFETCDRIATSGNQNSSTENAVNCLC